MSRNTLRGMHAIRCDWKPTTKDYVGPGFCSAIFRSNSQLSILGKQLEAAGWFTQPGTPTRERKDLCPDHKPRLAGWDISKRIRSESG